MSDPICKVCGEPRSAHVATDQGPLTHPREASGEGTYEFVSYWEGFDFTTGQWVREDRYRFVPASVH